MVTYAPPRAQAVRGPQRAAGSRYAYVDTLKAGAIVAVVWIHAFQVWGRPLPPVIERLGFLTRFAVPAFFFASGFLSGRAGTPTLRVVGRRLVRILGPYILASLGAMLLRAEVLHQPINPALELATGSAWGIYYFVPLLALVTLTVPVLARLPFAAEACFPVFLVLGLLSEMWILPVGDFLGQPPIFWAFRSPFRWWGYFFGGWLFARYLEGVEGLSVSVRRWSGVCLLALLASVFAYYLLALPGGWSQKTGALQYIAIYCAVLGIVMTVFEWREHPLSRKLSDATYPIYLYHYFFIEIIRHLVLGPAQNTAAFVAGCSGAALVVYVGRRLFGRYAWLVIG